MTIGVGGSKSTPFFLRCKLVCDLDVFRIAKWFQVATPNENEGKSAHVKYLIVLQSCNGMKVNVLIQGASPVSQPASHSQYFANN